MSVAYELKQKRAALIDRLRQLERERVDIQEMMRALERVILNYEPAFESLAKEDERLHLITPETLVKRRR